MVFIGYSQNIWRYNAMCRDELVADVVGNIGLKLKFSSWFSIHLLLHRLHRFLLSNKSNTIESNVSHRSVSYWERLSCKIQWSIHCVNTSGLKREFQSNVFDDVRNKVVSVHFTVTSNVMTVTDENHKRCIFPFLPVNVPRSNLDIIGYVLYRSVSYLESLSLKFFLLFIT